MQALNDYENTCDIIIKGYNYILVSWFISLLVTKTKVVLKQLNDINKDEEEFVEEKIKGVERSKYKKHDKY